MFRSVVKVSLVVFSIAFFGALSLKNSYAAENTDLVQARVNRLDRFAHEVLPELLQKRHWNDLMSPELVISQGDALGYHYDIKLIGNAVHLPMGACTGETPSGLREDQTDRVDASFKPGNVISAQLELPCASVSTELVFDLVPPGPLPALHLHYPVSAQGIQGPVSLTVRTLAGKLYADAADVSGLHVGRVDLQLGEVEKIVDLLLSEVAVCGPNARTLDTCAAQEINHMLRQGAANAAVVAGVNDLLLAHIKASLQISLDLLNQKIGAEIELQELTTTPEGWALANFSLALVPDATRTPTDPCAAALEAPASPPVSPYAFGASPRGDFEIGVPKSLLENTLYQVARQGRACAKDMTGKVVGLPYSLDVSPEGQILVERNTGDSTRLAIDLPAAIQFRTTSHGIVRLHTRNSHVHVRVVYVIKSSPEAGLFLELEDAELTQLSGQIVIDGIPLPLKWQRSMITKAVRAQLERQLPRISLVNAAMAQALGLQLQVNATADVLPDYLGTSFSVKVKD